MKIEFFIARKLIQKNSNRNSISDPILNISVFGISLSLAVMLVSVAVITGFKNEIKRKIIGFGSHIQIVNYDSNNSFEMKPVSRNQSFLVMIDSIEGIRHIQVFATKPGIIKTKHDIQGAIAKGVGSDYDWEFFKDNMVEGDVFYVKDSIRTNKVVISKHISDLLKLTVKDKFTMYFIDTKPRPRVFEVSGIYNTGLEDFDKQFILTDIKHIQKLNNWNVDQVSGFEILLYKFKDIDPITAYLKDVTSTLFYSDGSKLQVNSIKENYPQIFDWLKLIDLNVFILLAIMLIVGAVCMSSGLLIMILDRTNMIGILKALGMENKGIRNIFLYKSGYLIAKGLLYGNLIGLGICLIQNYFKILKLDSASYLMEYVPINLNIFYIFMVNIGTLLLIMLVMLLPSLVISGLSPAKTIRYT